jgi:hypothetical protein
VLLACENVRPNHPELVDSSDFRTHILEVLKDEPSTNPEAERRIVEVREVGSSKAYKESHDMQQPNAAAPGLASQEPLIPGGDGPPMDRSTEQRIEAEVTPSRDAGDPATEEPKTPERSRPPKPTLPLDVLAEKELRKTLPAHIEEWPDRINDVDKQKAGDPARFGGHATKGIVEGAMRDFLSELCDQFDQEEQARIRAAEASTTEILAHGTSAARDRRRVAESLHDSYWVFQPESDARIDSAGVVFVAYVNALWQKTDAARAECIHDFLAKVENLIEPVLTRYGREGKDLIDELRAECKMNASHVQSILRTSLASTTSSTEDLANEQSDLERGQSGNASRPIIFAQPRAILEFSDSWRERIRRTEDLEARYARRSGRNGSEVGRQEELLKDARAWAKAALHELVSEVQDVRELKERVVKQAEEFIQRHRYYANFRLSYLEFESALWQEGWPSLEECALGALIERADSAGSLNRRINAAMESAVDEGGLNLGHLAIDASTSMPTKRGEITLGPAVAKDKRTTAQLRLGSRVKKLKIESNLTWDTIARESHVSRRWLLEIAAGHPPSKVTKQTIGDYFSRTLRRRIRL